MLRGGKGAVVQNPRGLNVYKVSAQDFYIREGASRQKVYSNRVKYGQCTRLSAEESEYLPWQMVCTSSVYPVTRVDVCLLACFVLVNEVALKSVLLVSLQNGGRGKA